MFTANKDCFRHGLDWSNVCPNCGIQWNLYIKTTIGTPKMWSFYTGGLYKQVVFIQRWSLEQVWVYNFCTAYNAHESFNCTYHQPLPKLLTKGPLHALKDDRCTYLIYRLQVRLCESANIQWNLFIFAAINMLSFTMQVAFTCRFNNMEKLIPLDILKILEIH